VDRLVLVHGGVVGHSLASWASLHLDWVDISLNADFSYTVNTMRAFLKMVRGVLTCFLFQKER
jgi:isopentenyl phosphate kinase